MRNRRRESALDLYILLLSVFLFISPWLFARVSETTVDLLASGAAIAALSLTALIAFAIWEEWANLLLGIWLIAVGAGLRPHKRNASQHRPRLRGNISGGAGAVAGL